MNTECPECGEEHSTEVSCFDAGFAAGAKAPRPWSSPLVPFNDVRVLADKHNKFQAEVFSYACSYQSISRNEGDPIMCRVTLLELKMAVEDLCKRMKVT